MICTDHCFESRWIWRVRYGVVQCWRCALREWFRRHFGGPPRMRGV